MDRRAGSRDVATKYVGGPSTKRGNKIDRCYLLFKLMFIGDGEYMRHRTTIRSMAVVAMTALLLAAAPVQASSAAPSATRQHKSGLIVLDADDLYQPIPVELRDAAGAYDLLADLNPNDFGYVHTSANTLIVDVVTTEGDQQIQAMMAGTASARLGLNASSKVTAALATASERSKGVAVKTRKSTDSCARVEQLKHEITGVAYKDAAMAEAGIWQTSVDRTTGRVAIRMEKLTDAAASAIVARYGTERVEIVEQPDPHKTDHIGRLADNSPFYGGARIDAPAGWCSDVFSWNIDGVPGMLTAGHCAPNGGGVSTVTQPLGSITVNSRENYSSAGTTYLPGESVYRGDMALIQGIFRERQQSLYL